MNNTTISPVEVASQGVEGVVFYTPFPNQWENDVTRVTYDKYSNMFYEDDHVDPREFTVEEMQSLAPKLLTFEGVIDTISRAINE